MRSSSYSIFEVKVDEIDTLIFYHSPDANAATNNDSHDMITFQRDLVLDHLAECPMQMGYLLFIHHPLFGNRLPFVVLGIPWHL